MKKRSWEEGRGVMNLIKKDEWERDRHTDKQSKALLLAVRIGKGKEKGKRRRRGEGRKEAREGKGKREERGKRGRESE